MASYVTSGHNLFWCRNVRIFIYGVRNCTPGIFFLYRSVSAHYIHTIISFLKFWHCVNLKLHRWMTSFIWSHNDKSRKYASNKLCCVTNFANMNICNTRMKVQCVLIQENFRGTEQPFIKILLLYHLVWWETKLEALKTRSSFQILLFLGSNSWVV